MSKGVYGTVIKHLTLDDLINHFDNRHKPLKKNSTVIQDVNGVYSMDDIETALNHCRFVLAYRNIKWHMCFFKKNSNRLVVSFSGMRKNGNIFPRWSWNEFLDASLLCIDDPMIDEHEGLQLGWYYGNEAVDYCSYAVEIVKAISNKIGASEIIFYSSSGGGTAAIRSGCILDGSLVVAINPQIVLDKYVMARHFEKYTNFSLKNDKLSRNNSVELMKKSLNTKFLIIQNIMSETDRIQIEALRNGYEKEREYIYGLNQIAPNCIQWLYDSPNLFQNPHVCQDWPGMYWIINELLKSMKEGTAINNSLFMHLTELWYEHFAQLEVLEQNRRKVDMHYLSWDSISFAKRIYYIDSINIEKSDKIYNHCALKFNLEPNSLYLIAVEYIECEEGESPVVGIKDEITTFLVASKSIEVDKVICISTRENTDKLQLRLYPSLPKETKGKALAARGISIYSY